MGARQGLAARALALVLVAAISLSLVPMGATWALADEDDSTEEVTYSASEEPTLSCPAAILIDVDTGTVLLEKDADVERAPASTTKVMTALLVLENLSLDDTVTVEEGDFAELTSDSSVAGLVAGETLTVEDLLACLLIPSGNDAAYVLARAVAGSWEAFVDMMNARAEELGCTGTQFANPCGLPADGHYSTARDLATIMMAAIAYPEFCEIASSASWELPATSESAARTLVSTNLLIDSESSVYMGEGVITAAKTGYTNEAGRCLVAAAELDGMSLVGVVLGGSVTADASGVTENFYDMKDLLDWGFGAWWTGELVSAGDVLTSAEVSLSSDGDAVDAVATDALVVTVPRGTTLEDLTVEASWSDAFQAPLEEGDSLGEVTLSLDGRVLGTVGVAAAVAMGLSIVDFAFWWLSDPAHAVIAVVTFVAVAVVVWLLASIPARRRRRKRLRMTEARRRHARPGEGAAHFRPIEPPERRNRRG